MENSETDLAPDPETLITLYQLRDRYGIGTAADLASRCEMPQRGAEVTRNYLDPNHRRARRKAPQPLLTPW